MHKPWVSCGLMVRESDLLPKSPELDSQNRQEKTEVPLSKAPNPPIAPQACLLLTAPNVCALWVKCKGQITSMGYL